MDIIYQDSSCLALEQALHDEGVGPIDLPFMLLRAITKDFSDTQLIGRGGFGEVYKGVLPNGMVVAVKKLLDKIDVLEANFQSEVACLIEVKHRNIVRCLGYSSETQHVRAPYEGRFVWADLRQRLFCFEYLSKGSLADYLTGASFALQWSVRYQIIKGICEGVGYLHQHNIIHMDLKPQNILLDDNMVPKIADFGLSRRLSENQSRIITKTIIGTPGYLAPEFLSSNAITFKADIYSLGVIITEILTGHKECTSVDKVLESWTDMFQTLGSHPLLEQVEVCAEIAINCMNDDPSNRPTIQDIISSIDETDARSVTSSSPGGQVITMAGSESSSSRSRSPCASCRMLRQQCTQECVFAPYFPAEEPHKFAIVHKVFGGSNVFKLLQELPAHQRGDAVSSMVYEANVRTRDPVYGCVGAISVLQQQISQLQMQFSMARAEILTLQQQMDVNDSLPSQNSFDRYGNGDLKPDSPPEILSSEDEVEEVSSPMSP
ncbi:uncharacterized protein LOC100501207 [Zea mays]|uniref:Disease resistance protein RPM1 n=5 Tax=Zea mays TaxID=4577 RepID=K7TWK5_MAIZE|nr:uncharacterized protein LOC100501207 [Zea mays]AQK38954.1 Disease resistance protein RPM1 [Zea mays]|eukprot:XP_008662282.1 uncharacterized protein LOC100501207 isoform X1 [Zea mays]